MLNLAMITFGAGKKDSLLCGNSLINQYLNFPE